MVVIGRLDESPDIFFSRIIHVLRNKMNCVMFEYDLVFLSLKMNDDVNGQN